MKGVVQHISCEAQPSTRETHSTKCEAHARNPYCSSNNTDLFINYFSNQKEEW